MARCNDLVTTQVSRPCIVFANAAMKCFLSFDIVSLKLIYYGFSKFQFMKLLRAGNGNTMDGPSLIRRELILSANKVSSGNIDHLENHRGDPDL